MEVFSQLAIPSLGITTMNLNFKAYNAAIHFKNLS